MFLELKESVCNWLIRAVASEVDIENVFPIALFRWARFYLTHIDVELIECF